MTTLIQKSIAEKYTGDNFISITQWGNKYSFVLGVSRDELVGEIKKDIKTFEGYREVARYERVNDDALGIIMNAANRLDKNKKVDLTNLLAQ